MAARTQVLVQQIESLKQQRSVEPDVSVRSKLTANIYAIRRQIGEQHSSQLHRQGARQQPHHPNMSSSQNRPFQHQHAGQRGNRIQPHPHQQQQQQQQQHHSAHAHSQAQRNRHIHSNHRAAHHHQHPASLHGTGSMPSMPNTHMSPPRTRNPNHAQYNGNHNHNSLSAHSRDRRMDRVSRHVHSNSNSNSASSSQRRNQANSSSHAHHSAHTTKHQHRSPAPLNRAHTTSHLPRNRTPNSGPRSGGSGGYRAHAHAHAHMSSSSYAPPSPLAAHPHPPSTQAHHPKPKKQTLLELVTRLELDTHPFAYDYRTSQNKTLLAQMSGLHGGEGWQQQHSAITMTTPPESDNHRNQNQTRAHMAPCLRLINTLMCMEEAIHFISPPNDADTNPQLWQCFTSCDRNMCLEWIHSRLRCDYYETVGDFIADCARIWDNVYAVFGHAAGDDTCALKQEWIANAKLVQRQFLKRVVKIDTRIAGVDAVFLENGNPRLDPLQREFLSRAQVQTQIQTSLQKRQLQTPFPQMQQMPTQLSAQPPEGVHAMAASSSSNLSSTQPGESSTSAVAAEPKLLSEKEKRQQYLNNIDRDVTGSGTAYRRRKRQSKQTLRKSQSSSAAAADGDSNGKNDKSVSVETITSFVDAEEGEIKEALSKRQLFEVTVWWEFLQSFGETQCLQRVIMLQEGLRTTQAFEAYQRHMADKGHALALDMSIVGGPLCVDEQCKMYSLLLKTVERITTQNRFAEQQLKAMLQERSKHKHVSSAWQFMKLPLQTSGGGVVGGVGGESGSGRARMLDPYGNEAVQQRVKQKRSRDAMMMMAQKQSVAVGDEDEDEDDDFFDHLQCVPTTTTTATAQRSEMKSGMQRQDTMNQEPRVIGKEQYDRNIAAYKPIKPKNVVHGDGDGDEDGDVEIATEMNEVEINDVDLAVWMSHERSADEDMKSCSPQLQGDDEFEHADIEEKNEDEPMHCNTDDKAQVTAQSSSDTVAWSKYSYNSEQAMSAVPDF